MLALEILLCIMLLASAMLAVLYSNTLYSVIALWTCLLCAASAWMLLKVNFLAIMLLMIHAGIICSLLMYIIMMFSLQQINLHISYYFLGFLCCLLFLSCLYNLNVELVLFDNIWHYPLSCLLMIINISITVLWCVHMIFYKKIKKVSLERMSSSWLLNLGKDQ